jgi:hypothetical protein
MTVINDASKVYKGSNLASKVYAGPNQVWPKTAWSPANLPDLKGYWDADIPATITAAAGKVSSWAPTAGTISPMTQATASTQPSTGVATMNGRNTISFDNVDDFLASAAFNVPSPWTALIVFRVTANDQWKYLMTDFSHNQIIYTVGGPQGYTKASGPGTGSWYATIGTRHDIVYATPAVGNASVYENGGAPVTGDMGNAAWSGLRLGYESPGAPPAADIAAVAIMGSVIVSGDRALWNAWITSRWGS